MEDMSAYDSFMKKFKDTFGGARYHDDTSRSPYMAANMFGAHPDSYNAMTEDMGQEALWGGAGVGTAATDIGALAMGMGRKKQSTDQILDGLGRVRDQASPGRLARLSGKLGRVGKIGGITGAGLTALFAGMGLYDTFKDKPTGPVTIDPNAYTPSPGDVVGEKPAKHTVPAGTSPIGINTMEDAWKNRVSWLMQRLGLESPGEDKLGKTHVQQINGSDVTYSKYGEPSIATKMGSPFALSLFNKLMEKSGENIGHPVSALGNLLQGEGIKDKYMAEGDLYRRAARNMDEEDTKKLATPGMTQPILDPRKMEEYKRRAAEAGLSVEEWLDLNRKRK